MPCPQTKTLEPKVPIYENVDLYTIPRYTVAGLRGQDRRDAAISLAKGGRWTDATRETNTTTDALHSQIAALLNFNNDRTALDEYDALEFGTGNSPTAAGGCSSPVGRISIEDPSNEGDTFYMSELADEYEVNPEPNDDGTTPELTEMAAYSTKNDVYNFVTLNNPIKKTDDYILIVNISLSIGV